MVEQLPRYEELKIRLPEKVGNVEEVSAVLGIPRWWPTGARVGLVIAHGSGSNQDDPLIVGLQHELTERKFLCLRFNFPFAEAGRKTGTDSPDVLDQCFMAAISVLGRDPNHAPVQIVLGGKGIGAQIAANMARQRLPLAGLFFLGIPLHPRDRSDEVQADSLYRITSPMLFVQGTRDRRCDVDTLRRTLGRVGASTRLHVIDDADSRFKMPKRSLKSEDAVGLEIQTVLSSWLESLFGAQ